MFPVYPDRSLFNRAGVGNACQNTLYYNTNFVEHSQASASLKNKWKTCV